MRRIALSTFALFVCALNSYAQVAIVWNLAQEPTRVQSVRSGEHFSVRIANRLTGQYTVSIQRSRVPIPALDVTKLTPSAAPTQKNTCEGALEDFKASIKAAASEADVATAVDNLRGAARTLCTAAQQTAVVEPLITDLTQTLLIADQSLGAGEQLIVELARGADPNQKKFDLTLTTGAAVEWLTTYGFNYVPRHDQTYFLRPRNDGKFDIVPEKKSNEFDFVPSVLFSVFPASYSSFLGTRFGGSVGFGFNSKDPVLFLGPAVNVGQNVSIAAGLVMHPEKRLNPRLDVNTPVSDNLSDEQLHHSGYHPNWFIGIGVNFSGNPFKTNQSAGQASQSDKAIIIPELRKGRENSEDSVAHHDVTNTNCRLRGRESAAAIRCRTPGPATDRHDANRDDASEHDIGTAGCDTSRKCNGTGFASRSKQRSGRSHYNHCGWNIHRYRCSDYCLDRRSCTTDSHRRFSPATRSRPRGLGPAGRRQRKTFGIRSSSRHDAIEPRHLDNVHVPYAVGRNSYRRRDQSDFEPDVVAGYRRCETQRQPHHTPRPVLVVCADRSRARVRRAPNDVRAEERSSTGSRASAAGWRRRRRCWWRWCECRRTRANHDFRKEPLLLG